MTAFVSLLPDLSCPQQVPQRQPSDARAAPLARTQPTPSLSHAPSLTSPSSPTHSSGAMRLDGSPPYATAPLYNPMRTSVSLQPPSFSEQGPAAAGGQLPSYGAQSSSCMAPTTGQMAPHGEYAGGAYTAQPQLSMAQLPAMPTQHPNPAGNSMGWDSQAGGPPWGGPHAHPQPQQPQQPQPVRRQALDSLDNFRTEAVQRGLIYAQGSYSPGGPGCSPPGNFRPVRRSGTYGICRIPGRVIAMVCIMSS